LLQQNGTAHALYFDNRVVNVPWSAFHVDIPTMQLFFCQTRSSTLYRVPVITDSHAGAAVSIIMQREKDCIVALNAVRSFDAPNVLRIAVGYESGQIWITDGDLIVSSFSVKSEVTRLSWFSSCFLLVGTSSSYLLGFSFMETNDETVWEAKEAIAILKERNRTLSLKCDAPTVLSGNDDGGLFVYQIVQQRSGSWEYVMRDFLHVSALQPGLSDIGITMLDVDDSSRYALALTPLGWNVFPMPDGDELDDQRRLKGGLQESSSSLKDQYVHAQFTPQGLILVSTEGCIEQIVIRDIASHVAEVAESAHDNGSKDARDDASDASDGPTAEQHIPSFDHLPVTRSSLYEDSTDEDGSTDEAPVPLLPPQQYQSPPVGRSAFGRQSDDGALGDTPPQPSDGHPKQYESPSKVSSRLSPHVHGSSVRSRSTAQDPQPLRHFRNPDQTREYLQVAVGKQPPASSLAAPRERRIAEIDAKIAELSHRALAKKSLVQQAKDTKAVDPSVLAQPLVPLEPSSVEGLRVAKRVVPVQIDDQWKKVRDSAPKPAFEDWRKILAPDMFQVAPVKEPMSLAEIAAILPPEVTDEENESISRLNRVQWALEELESIRKFSYVQRR
jgi:hypothetical protein